MSLLGRIKGNHDAKTVASNFLYLSILKGITFIFPLITLPYLARVIGPDKFGAIAFATSIIVIVETVTDWGFNYTATRDVAVNRDNKRVVSEIFSQVLYARTILSVLCFIILLVLTFSVGALIPYRSLLLITFLYIPGNIMFPQWLFQALEKMKYITILTLLSRLFFTGMVFLVIRDESDYIFEPLLIACGSVLSGCIALYIIFESFGIRLIRPHPKAIMKFLRKSTDMFLSLLLPNLYTNFTTIILKGYCGDFATGIYNGGHKFSNIVDNLTQILSRAFFPYLARHKEKHHVYVVISGTIALIASVFMFFGADLFVRIFLTGEFHDAVVVMKIFAITPVFLFLMNTYGTNYLVLVGREYILRNIIIVVSVLGFGLTWWLTPQYSYVGAALTVTVVWGLRGVVTLYFAKKTEKKLNGQ